LTSAHAGIASADHSPTCRTDRRVGSLTKQVDEKYTIG